METMKDWYKGGDPNKKVPKLVVGELRLAIKLVQGCSMVIILYLYFTF